MTGGNVFDGALSALAPFGRLVAYGMAGRVPPKPVQAPSLMGTSRAVIGFWLAHCMSRPEMMDAAMNELLPLVAEGALKPGRRRALPDVRRPRGAPGPARPPHHRQARHRPLEALDELDQAVGPEQAEDGAEQGEQDADPHEPELMSFGSVV